MIELGDRVQDTVTKFKGIAMARAVWLYGCDRIAVHPQELDKEGGIAEALWFDEPQLKIIKKNAVGSKSGGTKPEKKTGGPGPTPSKRF